MTKNFGQYSVTIFVLIGCQLVPSTVQFKVDSHSGGGGGGGQGGHNNYNYNNYYYQNKNFPPSNHQYDNRQSAHFAAADATFNPSPLVSVRAASATATSQNFQSVNNNGHKRRDKIGSDQSSPVPVVIKKWTNPDKKMVPVVVVPKKIPSSPVSVSLFQEKGLNNNFNVHYHHNNDKKMAMNYYNSNNGAKTNVMSRTTSAVVEAMDDNYQKQEAAAATMVGAGGAGSKLNLASLAKALSVGLNPTTIKKVIRSVDESVPKNVLNVFKQLVAAGNRVVEFWDEKTEAMERNGVARDGRSRSPGTFEMLTYGLGQVRKLQRGQHFDTLVDRVSDATPPSQAVIQGLLMVKKLSQRVWSQDEEIEDDAHDDGGQEIDDESVEVKPIAVQSRRAGSNSHVRSSSSSSWNPQNY